MKPHKPISDSDAKALIATVPTPFVDLYRSPRNFAKWNTILAELLIVSGMVIGPEKTADIIARDPISAMALLVAHSVLEQQCPTRYLSAEIGEAFLQTELPMSIDEPPLPYPCMILTLPRDLLDSDDGLPIDSICIADLQHLNAYARESFPGVYAVNEDRRPGVRIVALTAAGECFGSIYFWSDPVAVRRRELRRSDGTTEAVISTLERIDRIAISAWLSMSYEPELVSLGDTPLSSSAATGRDPSGKKVPMAPTWIGWNYKRIQRSKRPGKSVSTDRRLRPHWRTGHWHTVCHGPKRNERRLAWFKPVYIDTSSQLLDVSK